ncbi:GNAT family N-acetyltransferase [Sanguibacter sp. HDW7]|uniref:GNAT family N-acetyltransferase n=1 Tax=Sanguibacter sp. HDW7 TaxID=2714931 RepID=UPI00140E828C|nr:GNAT family N-acetyltransferase [Sanguibacter sp. HDW7]QIK82975.1 GNAT family N-acetyltransferase [Sanguibacter sp. HDW7]
MDDAKVSREDLYRDAHRGLRALARPGALVSNSADVDLHVVIDELEKLVEWAIEAADADFGPSIVVAAPFDDARWVDGGYIETVDLDRGTLEERPVKVDAHSWRDSAMQRAARAYSRAGQYDMQPGSDGLWILHIEPVEGHDESWTGSLTGFVVLYDRDRDGRYEALAHVWTASQCQRRGVGTRLVREALANHKIAYVEGPLSEGGRRLLQVAAPDLPVSP